MTAPADGGNIARPHDTIGVDRMVDQLRALGVSTGDVLLVHASFRALRPVEGGPAGAIEALTRAVGAAGTVVMPSWPEDADAPFDPAATDAAPSLGAVARTFWRLPGVRRSSHPHAFAARGPDHCCARFALADGWLREARAQREGIVGHGTARLARSRAIVAAVTERLARDPLLFLHDAAAGCEECDAARASVA